MRLRQQIDQAGLCAAKTTHSRCDQQLEEHRTRLAVRRHPEHQFPALHLQFHGQAVGGMYINLLALSSVTTVRSLLLVIAVTRLLHALLYRLDNTNIWSKMQY